MSKFRIIECKRRTEITFHVQEETIPSKLMFWKNKPIWKTLGQARFYKIKEAEEFLERELLVRSRFDIVNVVKEIKL